MIVELFPFQKQAVNDLRFKIALALNNYRMMKVPQVISLQAPTGSGKTIIMSSLIEDILCGSENFTEQPNAIFVWLSDSPQLNEQSKQKLETKADKIRINQCVQITDESFDREVLEEGHIYFLNTQKLGRSGNLGRHSDSRQYTIWETIENTIKNKSDKLYFIIDEAHRGMQGRAAGTATTIMQKFLKGSADDGISPVPVVIGMSATSARFNKLVEGTTSTLNRVIVSAAQVRSSGLLKDRIVITYPEDQTKQNDIAVLQAATDEWMDKCKHWYQYTYEQHYANVNPVFVIQVTSGSGKSISDTNLDDVIAKVESRQGEVFKEGEVVHTFGSTGTITINGLTVPHVEPSEIADNRKIKVVLFKENLSTGWDCPRAETMMSFRRAEDATYIAQLLGRMVRTPLQMHIQVDDSLNDVRLFLPYFNKENVKNVVDELQNTEGGDIPTVIEGEALGEQTYIPWTVHTKRLRQENIPKGQIDLFSSMSENTMPAISSDGINSKEEPIVHSEEPSNVDLQNTNKDVTDEKGNNELNTVENKYKHPINISDSANNMYLQLSLSSFIDREGIIKFINSQGYLNYMVKTVRINNYLKSLLSLAGVLTQNYIYPGANDEIKKDVTEKIKKYIDDLHESGEYDNLAKQVMEMKLSVQIFDVFGEAIKDYYMEDLFTFSEDDIDRQLRAADSKLGSYGFPMAYGRKYIDFNNPNAFKIDCILYAANDECVTNLYKYAEDKFHYFNDCYRRKIVSKSEKCKKQYRDIVADGDIVSKHNFQLPEVINAKVEIDGKDYDNHLFADANGIAKIKLNSWEEAVLEEEKKHRGFVCWLRNPVRQNWSLRIPYEIDGVIKEMYPDFLIIREDVNLGYVVDILEPHSAEYKDNLGKAKGLASYAAEEPKIGRVQLIRMTNDSSKKKKLKRLELSKGTIRNKVLNAINNDELDHIFDTDGVFE